MVSTRQGLKGGELQATRLPESPAFSKAPSKTARRGGAAGGRLREASAKGHGAQTVPQGGMVEDFRAVPPGFRGIQNGGQDCWFNSFFTLVVNVPEFLLWLVTVANLISVSGAEGFEDLTLIQSFLSLAHLYLSGTGIEPLSFQAVIQFRANLREIDPSRCSTGGLLNLLIKEGAQEDPTSAMNLLIGFLQEAEARACQRVGRVGCVKSTSPLSHSIVENCGCVHCPNHFRATLQESSSIVLRVQEATSLDFALETVFQRGVCQGDLTH